MNRVLQRLEEGVLATLLAAMIGFALWQMLARNFLDSGLLWGDALVRVLVIWVAMFGAMVGARNADHIRIDLLARLVPPAAKAGLNRFAHAFTSAVLLIFAWFAMGFVAIEYEAGELAFGAVPAWLCVSILPVGAAVMGLRYGLHAITPPDEPTA